jgi:hypothetical protein
MGNYTGEIKLLQVKVNVENPKEGLVEIISSLDSDYEEYAGQIADNIINNPQNDDVVEMIDAVIRGDFGEVIEEGYNVLDELSTWILNNDTYCSGFESNIQNFGEYEFVTISYGV